MEKDLRNYIDKDVWDAGFYQKITIESRNGKKPYNTYRFVFKNGCKVEILTLGRRCIASLDPMLDEIKFIDNQPILHGEWKCLPYRQCDTYDIEILNSALKSIMIDKFDCTYFK